MTTDHLGSPRVVTDEDGRVTSRRDYTAFGEETVTPERAAGLGYAGHSETRKGYTGYEKDTESGLDFAQARYYNSVHGRFTSVDPLTASATIRNPQTFNRYTYVLNSPYKFTDPLGLIPETTGACGNRCRNSDGGGGGYVGRDASFDWAVFIDAGVASAHEAKHERELQSEPPAAPPPTNQQIEQSEQSISSTQQLIFESAQRSLMDQSAEVVSQRTGFTAASEGLGEAVPNSSGTSVNCLGYCLNIRGWVQAENSSRRSRLVIGSVLERNGTVSLVDTNIRVAGRYTAETAPTAFGGREALPGEFTPFGFRRLRLFLDQKNANNWHIVRLDDGFWSSKNGRGPRYVNIRLPNSFYAKFYGRGRGFKVVDFFVVDYDRNRR